MKKRSLLVGAILIVLLIALLSSCSKYEIRPGTQAEFEKLDNGAIVISEQIKNVSDRTADGKRIIQQPAAFFLKKAKAGEGADYVYAEGAQAYMDMLVNKMGFELCYENLGYVYNTWCFVHPDSNKEIGAYGSGHDIKVRHYYDASTSSVHDWIDVTLDTDLFVFGDLGYRMNEKYERKQINGEHSRDAFVLRKGKYYALSETLYTYTKPFASNFYGFYGYDGACGLIINGGTLKSYDALISDYEDFNSDDTDMILISKDDGSRLLGITWKHKDFEVCKTYDLADFKASSLNEFIFNYDYNEFDKNDALCITVRPLWIDRTGECESVVYFYGEFRNDDGEIYTVEGLLAAPFCLEENSEKFSYSTGGSGGGGYSGVPDSDGPYIPDHSKLDCLTCGGDGDCNTCGGYGRVERYMGAGETVTSSCTSCDGSGNCRTCGGSGKR